jgi:triosephosphate isomerase (TIM)
VSVVAGAKFMGTMRKPVIAGNWKMYKRVGESVETALALKSLVANANHCEVVIAPVFTALKTVADRLEGSNVRVAGQNCSTEVEHGAHTGEVAADMLKDAGASHVIIGHSERRQYYGETDTSVRKKAQAAVAAGLVAIVCVGETLAQRDEGNAEAVVRGQLEGGLSGLTASDLDRIIIAYEPVWAIGTGRTATPETSAGNARFHPARFRAKPFAGGGGKCAHPVRRFGQAGQHRGPDGAAGHRRRPRRRREPQGRQLRADRKLQQIEFEGS